MSIFKRKNTNKNQYVSEYQDDQSGFTLIETAIVVGVIGIMISGLVIGLPQYLNNKKIELTNQKMEMIETALSAYAQRHYRLPCPGVTNNVGTRGEEQANCFAANATEQQLYANTQGAVPWRELGLSEQDVTDGWGRYITYKPAPHLTVDTYQVQMQEDTSMTDSFGMTPSVHNACRNQVWYNAGRNHLNRQNKTSGWKFNI